MTIRRKIHTILLILAVAFVHGCIRDEVLLPPDIRELSTDVVTSGEILTIRGNNFDRASVHVFLDGKQIGLAGSATLTELSIVVPAVETQQESSLSVTTKFGGSKTVTFTIRPPVPLIRSLIPDKSGIGTTIRIAGKHFHGTSAVSFKSPDQSAEHPAVFTSINDDTLAVTVPAGLSKDAATITVISPSGQSGATFTVIFPPTLVTFSPETGGVGTLVKVIGTELRYVQLVQIGNKAAKLISSSDQNLQFSVPADASSDTIRVTTVGGTGKTNKKFTVLPPPEITSLDKLAGGIGSDVAINGKNFNNAFRVLFGNVPATVSSNSGTQIKTKVPDGAASGKVTVVTPAGEAKSPENFVVTGAPIVTSFSPLSGIAGQKIIVHGLNFGASTTTPRTLKIGAKDVTLLTTWSDNLIEGTIPAGVVTGKITVTAIGGTFVTDELFTVAGSPQITNVSPASGVSGTVVTITGQNFKAAPSVFFFNNVKATSISQATATQIVCQVPAGSQTGKITVDGAVSPANFTIASQPVITSITPPRGGVGTDVTITGSHLTGATVKFTNNVTAVATGTDTQLNVKVPASAVTGKISVSNSTGTTVSQNDFQVLPPPTISSFAPLSGIPGTVITITGSNLQYSPIVTFSGGAVAVIRSVSATQLIVEVPAAASTGKISVKTEGVLTAINSSASFGIIGQPAIAAISPGSGAISQKIVLTGTNFDNIVSVNVGGVVTSDFISAPTSTRVEVRIPENLTATSSRGINIKLTTVAGVSPNFAFTLLGTPVITKSSPADNPTTWALLITGTNLTAVSRVTINGADAVIDYKAANAITTRVPANAPAGSGAIKLYFSDIKSVETPYIVLSAAPPGVFPPPQIIIPPPPPANFIPAGIDADWSMPYSVDQYYLRMDTNDEDDDHKPLASGSITASSHYSGADPELQDLLNVSGDGGWNHGVVYLHIYGQHFEGTFNGSFQIVLTSTETGRQLVIGGTCPNFPSCH